jgi:hypothetical protein
MPDTVTTLAIKDGTATASGLSAISSSTGYSTYHALTGTLATDMNSKLENLVDIKNASQSVSSSLKQGSESITTILSNYTILASAATITTASYTELKNGTAITASALPSRKTLIFFNHTNADVYMAIGSTLDVNNGLYTYVIASSGSYTSEHRYAGLVHYLTGSSDASTGRLTITSLTKPS